MAELLTIARPYAQAVFELARESRALVAWSKRLQRLAAIAEDDAMTKIIGHPRLTVDTLAGLFLSLSGETNGTNNQELTSFVALLAKNRRLSVLPQIREIYERLKSDEEGVKEARVLSAYPIDEARLAPLRAQLEAHFACKLRTRVEVDAALIGGIRVEVGDVVLDASVRGKLDAMAATLKN